jgi:hypothetical protein
MSYDTMSDHEKGLLLLGVPVHEDVEMYDAEGTKTNVLMHKILKASAAFIRGARELRRVRNFERLRGYDLGLGRC